RVLPPFAASSVERGRRPLLEGPMVYRKGDLSKAMMDRDWPHQVDAYRCMGHEYLTIHIFCQAEGLSLCSRRHSYRRGGDLIDPATRLRWPGTHAARTKRAWNWSAWFRSANQKTVISHHLFAEERLRNGRCINCDD